MPMISGGQKVLAHYPDGSEKIITLYADPLEGQTIAHGWVVAVVTSRNLEVDGVLLRWEITVGRPN
jgi:hypothetical protein